MLFRRPLFAALLGVCMFAHAAPELVFIAPSNHEMPLAAFEQGQLSGGVLKDLGELMAQRMGRVARFVTVPSKRVAMTLTEGQADLVCYVRPLWIQGDFLWTKAFIPNHGTIAARTDAPPIHSLKDLAGQRVGTVAGYVYPQLDAALGASFVRDDAPSMALTFSKMGAGRTRYAIIEQMTMDWQKRQHPELPLKTALVFAQFKAECAVSRASHVPFAQIDKVVDSLIADSSIERILSRYR